MPLKLLLLKEKVAEMYTQGKSVPEIARELGEYRQPVELLLKHLGIYNSYLPKQGNIRYFQYINTAIKAYFLGFITADGCIQSNAGSSVGLTITIHAQDIHLLEKLKQEMGNESNIMRIRTKHTQSDDMKNHCRLAIFNRDLYNDLISQGLTSKKTLTIPNIISNVPEQFRKAFVLGYFDGDGSASYNPSSKQMNISFRGTHGLLGGIADVLDPSTFDLRKDKKAQCWTLSMWRKGDILSFYNIYKELDFYLDRKYQKIRSFLKIDKEETISQS